MFNKKHAYRILFKSGQTIDIMVRNLKVAKKDSELLQMTWEDMRPHPMFIDISQIVAIFEER